MSQPPLGRNHDDGLDEVILEAIELCRVSELNRGTLDLSLYDVLAYHLGFVNDRFEPDRLDSGKRIRPRLCILACEAAGGIRERALRVAAAIELLHNFTLIHDDIQDQSPLRRHRHTVWSLWGVPQAINAGDAMFSLAHLVLNRTSDTTIGDVTVVQLSTELHHTTLRIVEGQALDLGFENRPDVTVDEYLTMISGKTAAICRYACWAGATLARASSDVAQAFGEFGHALGIGFQLQDDLLGVWGSQSMTGKVDADDIRRRKKSLPLILLRERATDYDRDLLADLYSQPELSRDDVDLVLRLMTTYEVREYVQEQVSDWHAVALRKLDEARAAEPARSSLLELVRTLESRVG